MSALPVPAAPLPADLTALGSLSTGETILLAVVALVTTACGIGVLTARRAVHAAINMIAIMICLAVLYVANEAPFLGITQVVVYTGAVMTLVMFVIMLVGLGGDEPTAGPTSRLQAPVLALTGLGLAATIGGVALAQDLGTIKGLRNSEAAEPAALASFLYTNHVVLMEVTGLLLVVAALGALTLTHRDRVRPKATQRDLMEARMRAYAQEGAHPGQKPMPGVYARTNTAAAPALAADGKALTDSVPRPLVARGQDLELADVAPGLAAALRADKGLEAGTGQSGMDSMPGAPAPAATQLYAPEPAPRLSEAPAAPDSKEETK